MCTSYPASTCSDERFYRRRGLEGVFFHYCSMINDICIAPYWKNKSISLMPPSDDGPYLTSVWTLLMTLDWGRPYFTMGGVIT